MGTLFHEIHALIKETKNKCLRIKKKKKKKQGEIYKVKILRPLNQIWFRFKRKRGYKSAL